MFKLLRVSRPRRWTWIGMEAGIPVETGLYYATEAAAIRGWESYHKAKGIERTTRMVVLPASHVEAWLDGWQAADAWAGDVH